MEKRNEMKREEYNKICDLIRQGKEWSYKDFSNFCDKIESPFIATIGNYRCAVGGHNSSACVKLLARELIANVIRKLTPSSDAHRPSQQNRSIEQSKTARSEDSATKDSTTAAESNVAETNTNIPSTTNSSIVNPLTGTLNRSEQQSESLSMQK